MRRDLRSDGNDRRSLIRGLGLIGAASIVVGNVIGQGVFLKARVMACNVDTPVLVLGAWVAAGALSLAGALTYAELAARMPRAGGEYVYVRKAYGRRLGFLYGWMQMLIAKTGSQAALSVGFAIFLNALLGGALDRSAFTIAGTVSMSLLQIVAISAIVVVTLINCATVAMGGRIAALLTVVKVSMVLGIGLGAFLLTDGSWTHLAMSSAGSECADVSAAARGGLAGFGAAMLGALWAYDGWNNLTLVGGEVKRPSRNIPLALISGMFVIASLYTFVNLAYFYVLSPAAVAGLSPSVSVATEVAIRILGPAAAGLMAAALLASTFGTLHTSILTGARIPYAMAEEGQLPPGLGRLSERSRVPILALILQGAWAAILAMSGTYDTLTDYVIFGSWIFYALTAGSIFIFRRQETVPATGYRTWGYPVVPILFVLTTAWLLINTLITAPLQSFTGLALVALGLPVYSFVSRRYKPIVDETEAVD